MKHLEFSQYLGSGGLKTATVALALCFSSAASAQQAPPKPSNVNAATDFSKVALTWDNPAAADTLLKEDFEGAAMPEGWSVKTTNTYDPFFTWFHFPTAEMVEEGIDDETYAEFTHDSKGSALLQFDYVAPHEDESSATQDEWLIMPATPGARYVDFYYYLPDQLIEWGPEDYFPDHYYVKVSHDGGKTWTVAWDGRYEIAKGYGQWRHATVYLGDPADGDPIVAFNALSSESDNQTGLYCNWVIDDVALLGSKAAVDYTPAESYNVYFDNELMAMDVKAMEYTDTTAKTAGTHTYGIQAVAASGAESDIAELRVNIEEATVNPPTNVKVTYSYDEESGKYNVDMTWDKPEGTRTPAYYMAYANGALIGGYVVDMGVGQTGIPKGFYQYTVKAVYEMPDGESEAVGDVVALGTRQAPYNMAYVCGDDNTLTLSWTAAKASDYELKAYAVFRGNEKIGETTATMFAETGAPDGLYDYSVKAVYADGVMSLPATVSVSHGDKPVYTLPFSEDFTGGLKPGNWTIEKLTNSMKDSYLWRFDNLYELPINGGGFDSDFASICSSVAGYTNVSATIDTPPLTRGAKDGERTLLEFDMDFKTLENVKSGTASEAGVYFSYDGEMWKAIDDTLKGYTAADLAQSSATCAPVHMQYDITDCFQDNESPLYIAWRYKGRRAYHFAIDNVKVYNTPATAIAGVKGGQSDVAYKVADGELNVSASAISRIQVYAADGACTADVTTGGAATWSLPLGKGLNIVRVTTANGVKTFKVVM